MGELINGSRCTNCANIHSCSGPDYIDGSCYPGYKPIEHSEKSKNNSKVSSDSRGVENGRYK